MTAQVIRLVFAHATPALSTRAARGYHQEPRVNMFEEPPRHFPSEFLWWGVAFTAAIALVELWMRDYQDVAFHATLTLLLVVHVRTEGRPAGWLRVTQWSLVGLMGLLFILRVMRWTGVSVG